MPNVNLDQFIPDESLTWEANHYPGDGTTYFGFAAKASHFTALSVCGLSLAQLDALIATLQAVRQDAEAGEAAAYFQNTPLPRDCPGVALPAGVPDVTPF